MVKKMNYMTKDKPYNSLNNYYKKIYNSKVAKISLNANFTCPNKDGTKGFGGCIYCSKLGSGDFAGDKNDSLAKQFNDIKTIIEKKWPNTLYIPYLQANSNTYAPLERLKKIYEEVLTIDLDKTVGLAIATRPDCLSEDICKYLAQLNQRVHISVELGLQTANENTAKYINRGLTNEEFINGVKLLRKYNLEVIVHIINGLPNETIEDMLNTINFINNLDIQGIKFHCLLVLKNTKLYEQYKEKPFKILTLKEYVDITTKQITHLRSDIIIHRLQADANIKDLVEPKWSTKKLVVMNEIDKKLRNDNDYQGKYYRDTN